MAKFLDFPNIKRRLALSILPGSDVEAPASDRSSGHCLLSMPKMTEIAMRISRLCWGLLPMSLTLTGCLSPIATREAVQQVEDTFAAHRAELDELATTAIAELERSGESALKLPDQPFYDRAWLRRHLAVKRSRWTLSLRSFICRWCTSTPMNRKTSTIPVRMAAGSSSRSPLIGISVSGMGTELDDQATAEVPTSLPAIARLVSFK